MEIDTKAVTTVDAFAADRLLPRPVAFVEIVIGMLAAVAALAVAGCAAPDPPSVVGITVPDGFGVIEVVTGLDGPTQLAALSDGRFLVAELAGKESAGTGRITALTIGARPDPTAEDRQVLVGGLLKPTGVAAIGDELWVMEERTLSRGPLTGGALSPVLDGLPYNGRSETTLTVTPAGTLLYGTSGSLRGGAPMAGSGILWELDPAAPADRAVDPTSISAGFKNPYGHVVDGQGRLWVTEISDGSFDGTAAADELVAVTAGIDHGWPACVGDRRPAAEFGGTPETCAAGPHSHALFAPGATPTSVAVAPWDEDLLVVALWLERRVVTVPTDPPGAADPPHEAIDLLTGDLRPQHLLADGDRLLVVDHEGGRILAVTGP